jgi:hypothetical protein
MDQWGENNEKHPAAVPPASSILEHETLPGVLGGFAALSVLLVALYPAWAQGWMPVRGDAMTYFWPLREALGTALRDGTLPLYETTNNGGTPLWLNPQTQSFYPPARLYRYLPAPHAMGILHAAHLVLLFGGTVALLRRLAFRYSSASLAALCVGLGGTFLSVSPMQDKAHSAAWIPLMLWAGLSLNKKTVLPRLVLVATTVMAVFAGGLDIVVLGILATIFAASVAGVQEPVVSEPTPDEEPIEDEGEDLFGNDLPEEKEEGFQPLSFGSEEEGDEPEPAAKTKIRIWTRLMAEVPMHAKGAARHSLDASIWIALGLGLSATQWLPFRSLIETSDWGQALPSIELSARALRFGDVLGLLAPNLAYDPGLGIYRPPGQELATGVYLPGLYAGGGAILLWLLGIAQLFRTHFSQAPERWLIAGPNVTATIGSLLCVVMAAGPAIPLVGWMETSLPILSSIRYPEKWLLPAAILAAVPIAEGARLLASSRLSNRSALGLGAVTLATVLITALIGTLSDGDAGRGMSLAAGALGVGLLVCVLWRLQALPGQHVLGLLGLTLAIVITGAELSAHNLPLAPLEDPAEMVSPPVAARRILRSADTQRRNSGTLLPGRARLHQASYAQHDADPVTSPDAPLHLLLREALLGGVASVWGIEVMREWLVMSPSGLEQWYDAVLKMPMARQFNGLRLAGVTHIVVHFRDDALELLPLVGNGLEEVYSPEGDWTQIVIFALTDPLPSCRWTPQGMPTADGLPVVPDTDSAGIWHGRVSAGNGLLVCLRPWDPAWHVEVDGKTANSQIVNGFQLGVPVPAGVHEVYMEYRPRGLQAARHLRTLSAGALVFLLGLGLLRLRKEQDAAETSDSPQEQANSEDVTEHYETDNSDEDGSYLGDNPA